MTHRETGESPVADDLTDSVRRLMHAAATTSSDDRTLRDVGRQLDEISALLTAESRAAVRRVPLDDDRLTKIRAGEAYRMFPFNPMGVPQSIQLADGIGRSVIELGALHEGPPGKLHGGFSAAVLDALIGVVVMAEVVPAYSVQLDVSFIHTVPLPGVVEARGWVTDVGARRILAEGTISHEGRVVVSARGVFVPMTDPFVDGDAQARVRVGGSQSG